MTRRSREGRTTGSRRAGETWRSGELRREDEEEDGGNEGNDEQEYRAERRRLCSFHFLEISCMYLDTTPREDSSLGNIYTPCLNLCGVAEHIKVLNEHLSSFKALTSLEL